MARARQAVVVTEWTNLFVVLIEGDFAQPIDLDLLGMALEVGHLTGKQVAVDVSRIQTMSAEVLNVLLQHRHRAGTLPWLVGPLGAPAARRLEITGTLPHFRIFPALPEALDCSRDG
ncbi:hypothetical protein AB0Q95_45400 [Streptomyces sp. NPDC059900]|uniref:hypothetical protein n=1 Tax=Streptomyces sp. NPDC059900 TaxID=3155816 RepID=UPI00344503BF